MNIIQHHKPIDFEALFKQMQSAVVGLDGNDIELFAIGADEIHSFFGSAKWKDRVKNALGTAIASDEAVTIISRSNAFMLIIKHNPESKCPATMNEMSAINDFISELPEKSDIQWSLIQDASLGERIEFILLCNIRK
jgi:hypothetical protein